MLGGKVLVELVGEPDVEPFGANGAVERAVHMMNLAVFVQ